MIVAAAALAALAASPALARTQHGQPTASHHSAMSDYDAAYGANAAVDGDGYAGAPGPAGLYGSSPPVIFENKVVGQDPDPNVRMMIEKDPGLLAQ
jgi:hypothetical protein